MRLYRRVRNLELACLVVLIMLSASSALAQTTAPFKNRRQIATWLVTKEEKSFGRIRQNADILDSLSVFGNPPAGFIDQCHQLKIRVYLGVSGNGSAFDTPARAQATLEKYVRACRDQGYDGIDLDFEHLDPGLQDKYSEFLRGVSTRLHAMRKNLSHCVGFYPGMDQVPPRKIFYDPEVVAQTCDLIRVMCYDLYWAPGRGDPKQVDRPDTQGIGPTSHVPWAREAMRFWLSHAPREKLIMGLPAYSNDYSLAPKGRGQQVYAAKPQAADPASLEKAWLWYEKLFVYLYNTPNGERHLFYASDADSTKSHLQTVDELNLPGIGFWHFSSVDAGTWEVVRDWIKRR
jgi:spore germination protein YaaH